MISLCRRMLRRPGTAIILLLLSVLHLAAASVMAQDTGQARIAGTEMLLDGEWETGIGRSYTTHTTVPGLAGDPTKSSPGTLWYRRRIQLPPGGWKQAVLTLKGARFAPEVYVNGHKVSSSGGGMAPTVHVLSSAEVAPGATITLEIALKSMEALDPEDASMVPQPDRWRSDNSSGLWDSVMLHFAGASRIERMTPFTDFAARKVSIHWAIRGMDGGSSNDRGVQASLVDGMGKTVARSAEVDANGDDGVVDLPLAPSITSWSPEHPVVYKLRLEETESGRLVDARESSWGLKQFHADSKTRRFYLNGEPVQLRGGTVVWHRFLRNPEARMVAFDPAWFDTNVMRRLKSHGANLLRFHLGLPPESLLDLCDQDGLIVQLEWPFFHGIKASDASMREQWHEWLDVAMRHPSVMIVHPWNETDGDELKAGWKAMDAVLRDYPALVVAHRDTLHIHKYWWSLFENLGLYYDSADQFDRTAMVDEFGGDYLDQQGDAGLYPATKETFLRFLGRTQTREMRLQFQAEANARVGEYWRRLGVAGIAPFCILGSPEDGSSWFLGHMQDPHPMPVWDALTATFAPQSVSLDVWDRNYVPGQRVEMPVFFFNDTSIAAILKAEVRVVGMTGSRNAASTQTVEQQVPAHGRVRTVVPLTLPALKGDWRFEAELKNAVPDVTHPILSSWMFRTLTPEVPPVIAGAVVGVPEQETELRRFLTQNGLRPVAVGDRSARLVVTSSPSWTRLAKAPELRRELGDAINRGVSVVMLDIGPRDLGQGYRVGDPGSLEGAPRIPTGTGYSVAQDLFDGIKVTFSQVAEPESHVQPGPEDSSLWNWLPIQSTWLWNGLRGGLIAPSADMGISGLGAQGFAAEWVQRGAVAEKLQGGSYFAYQLAGYYAFSTKANDAAIVKSLQERVKFLVEDAPALADAVDPNAKVEQTDLAAGYRNHADGKAEHMIALSTCGKSLTRTEVAELTFGAGKGNLILSQALTAGRLTRGSADPGLYGIRYDPAAEQFVLNMLARAMTPMSPIPSVVLGRASSDRRPHFEPGSSHLQ